MIRSYQPLLTTALLVVGLVQSLRAAEPVEFFVAPRGADAEAGSRASPFATLARAHRSVREALTRDRSREVTVWMDAGTYELEKPLAFGPEDSPSGTARVNFRALDGKPVVISGGQQLSGWTASADGRWTMEVPGVKIGGWYPRQLFISGARRTRARTPNVGELRGLKSDDALRVQFPPDVLRGWTHPGDAELVTLVEWTPSRVRLGALDLAKQTVTFDTKVFQFFDETWGQGIRKNMRNFPFYLENAPEMLDAPGEWYLDRTTGRLTYLPEPDERTEQAETVMPRLEQLLIVRGTAERPVQNLHFHGITFAHTDWALPKNGFLPDQAGFFDTENVKKGLPVPAAALDFQYATDCTLEQCVVRDVGGHAIRFCEGCVSNTLAGCRIEGVGGNGVSLGLFDRAAAERDVVRGNAVRDCSIRRCGLDYAGCVGVWVGIARDITIAQNEVSEIPYSGISVGWRWDREPVGCGGHVVEGNNIHHVVQLLTDAGGIYVLGDQPGGVIRRNHIHDITRRSGIAAANGIFFDNGSRGWRVEENVIYGVSGGAIRHNDNRHEDQSWGTNHLDVRPGADGFPDALTKQAGPRGVGFRETTEAPTNRPPIVRVVAPKATDDLRAPANFTCTAEAGDPDGRVTKVEFYAWSHALKLGTATNAPYTITAKPVFTVARMSIIARAYDDQGAATDSEPVWITVTDDVKYPPRAKPREERLISTHVAGSGHEGVPSLVELPNGDLLCAFYSGRYELSFDSSVYLTRLPRGAGEWEKPRIIIGGDNISKANPVLMLGADGVLWCFYSNIENGQEFECARPCYRQSRDGGKTWDAEVRMPERKFAHRTGTLFALKPIRLTDGTLVLPANRESDNPDQKYGWTSFFYRSTDAGKTWTETPEILSSPGNIQPTIQQLNDGSLLGFFRPRGRNAKLWRSTSHDGGETWAPPEPTTLDNPSTRSDFVALPNGKLVLACNVSPVNRTPVNLLLSDDLGKTWRVDRAVETGPGPYGYCAVIRTRDGKIHVAYDTDRRIIKHAVVDEAWFDEPAVIVEYQRP